MGKLKWFTILLGLFFLFGCSALFPPMPTGTNPMGSVMETVGSPPLAMNELSVLSWLGGISTLIGILALVFTKAIGLPMIGGRAIVIGGFELCNSELFELAHDSCVDWHRCDKPCVVVYHSEGCFENWKDSERFGERIMIERDLMYLAMAFVAGVVCHRFVMAAFKQLFGWINK